MKFDILSSEKGNLLKNINNLKYKIDDLEKFMSKVKFHNIDQIRELSGEIYAINILIETLISFAILNEYLGDDEK